MIASSNKVFSHENGDLLIFHDKQLSSFSMVHQLLVEETLSYMYSKTILLLLASGYMNKEQQMKLKRFYKLSCMSATKLVTVILNGHHNVA